MGCYGRVVVFWAVLVVLWVCYFLLARPPYLNGLGLTSSYLKVPQRDGARRGGEEGEERSNLGRARRSDRLSRSPRLPCDIEHGEPEILGRSFNNFSIFSIYQFFFGVVECRMLNKVLRGFFEGSLRMLNKVLRGGF